VPVISVTEDQTIDAANQLRDVYSITYTIPNRPGSFTVQVDKTAQALADAEQAIADLTVEVNGIYGIP
jgi:hypothetical protein